ncbi:class I SAM-dependent methyltransferase [Catenulispora rubra]|uniref:class I SAM-dependent methyltransferase n=1 Tax=Catenulispora rubra TaxID=280293 RepID=UPI001E2DD1F4|nr:class I SAM-dependent methyltransferase [Catenulispora rubra]
MTGPAFTDDDSALMYDVENPWDPDGSPYEQFLTDAAVAVDAVLDVGCGTGSYLHTARERGAAGRLVGVDPDESMLARARRRTDIEWLRCTAAEMTFEAEFAAVTMNSNAFQCLAADDELRASLAAIRRALRPGGVFMFGTRHLQARAWEGWNPDNGGPFTMPDGREYRGWFEVESVDGPLVTFTDTVARLDGTPLRVARATLRFHTPETLNPFLEEAGFAIENQYGDQRTGPLTDASREIITYARAQ